ncbi:MAG: hypothetical protein ACJA1N_002104 [Saprospiraceae bacterium]|jgi:hypothetical protein
MKKQLSILLILVLNSFVFTNCKSTTEETTQETIQETTEEDEVIQSWKKVMAVHDDIMPITMKFPPMKEKLIALADSESNSAQVEKIKAQITDIQEAYDAMYKWMAEANSIKKGLQEIKKEAALRQLVDEAARINQVKISTENAFKNATKMLEELNK